LDAGLDTEATKPIKPDPTAWLEEHGDYLFRYALSRVRNRELAEDMVQEALLGALGSINSFSGKSSIRTWLASIMKHKIIDHFRKSKRETSVEDEQQMDYLFENAFDDTGHWSPGPAKWSTDPSKTLDRSEFWAALEICLKDLPEKHAQAYSLRELDGMDGEEICKVLDISSTNLWVILHRARLSLRGCLEIKYFGKR
jgi:RNA polymerase sigma-70 factor (TIGR02943 family)